MCVRSVTDEDLHGRNVLHCPTIVLLRVHALVNHLPPCVYVCLEVKGMPTLILKEWNLQGATICVMLHSLQPDIRLRKVASGLTSQQRFEVDSVPGDKVVTEGLTATDKLMLCLCYWIVYPFCLANWTQCKPTVINCCEFIAHSCVYCVTSEMS